MLLHGYVGECEKYNGEYEKHTHTPQRIQHRTENVHRMHTMDMVYICVASKVLLPDFPFHHLNRFCIWIKNEHAHTIAQYCTQLAFRSYYFVLPPTCVFFASFADERAGVNKYKVEEKKIDV